MMSFLFWDRLCKVCLLNKQAAFSQSEDLHSNLIELRNSALVIFAVCNILWLAISFAILSQRNKFNSNFFSFAFLTVCGRIMVLQFVTLLAHRVSTWLHCVSTTSFIHGSKGTQSWSFSDKDMIEAPSVDELEEAREVIGFHLRKRSLRRTIQAKERAEYF